MPCGFLVIDKPRGMTSRRAVDRVKRLVKPAKCGHAGTLDPLATGVLVVAVGRATRLISRLHNEQKIYRAEFTLGSRSPTDDTEVEVEVIDPRPSLTEKAIREVLSGLTGEIDQVPPAYSAVKVDGQRAYHLARSGEEVQLKAKRVVVSSIDILCWDSPRLEVEICCSGGTYIRSIARDLGVMLDCGGVMSGLARTRVGPLSMEDAIPVEELDRKPLSSLLLPPEVALVGTPRLTVATAELTELFHGRRVRCPDETLEPGGEVAAVDSVGQLAAVCEIRQADGATWLAPRLVFLEEAV